MSEQLVLIGNYLLEVFVASSLHVLQQCCTLKLLSKPAFLPIRIQK